MSKRAVELLLEAIEALNHAIALVGSTEAGGPSSFDYPVSRAQIREIRAAISEIDE